MNSLNSYFNIWRIAFVICAGCSKSNTSYLFTQKLQYRQKALGHWGKKNKRREREKAAELNAEIYNKK